MRTTIRLDDGLLKELRVLAAETDRTMTSLIEEALRNLLARQKQVKLPRDAVRLATVGGNGLFPGVDLDDGAALLDLMNTDDTKP